MQDEPNGILPLIRGEVIGRTSRELLPTPGAGQPVEQVVEVDTGRPHGRVRIKYRLMRHRHGKSENWFWTAVHAEPVEVDPLDIGSASNKTSNSKKKPLRPCDLSG